MSEQPGNGYARAPRPGVDAYGHPFIEFGSESSYRYDFPTPEPPSWGTFTYAVIYDGEVGSPRTALDFVRASNRWPKAYSTVLWAGSLS